MAIYGTKLSIDAYRPLNRADKIYISPGWVGSIGDVHVTPRLKHSMPDLPIRWQKQFAGPNAVYLGSNVSDGQHIGYDGGGGPARLIDSNWGGRRSFKTQRGWIVQDLRAADNLTEPFVSALGDYSWRDRIARTYESLRTGDNFMPVPGPYQPAPGEVPRGGSTPRVTDVNYGDTINLNMAQSAVQSATTWDDEVLRRGVSKQGRQFMNQQRFGK